MRKKRMKLKSCKTIAELRLEFNKIESGVAGDTIFGAKALMFMAERLSEKEPAPRRARITPAPPSTVPPLTEKGVALAKQVVAYFGEEEIAPQLDGDIALRDAAREILKLAEPPAK